MARHSRGRVLCMSARVHLCEPGATEPALSGDIDSHYQEGGVS